MPPAIRTTRRGIKRRYQQRSKLGASLSGGARVTVNAD
jgi:hypothetical protein